MADKTQATEQELGLTHKDFSEWCRTILRGVPLMDKDGAAVLKPDGQPWLVPPSPAHMNVIRQFLKDNGIEAVTIPMGDASTDRTLQDLPVFDEDGVVVPIKANQR